MITIATNAAIVGKPAKGFAFPKDGWTNCEFANISEVMEMIVTDGWPITAELDDSGYRDKEHFVSRQVFPVDVDDGMTIDELKNNQFYQLFGCGYYASPSHTEEHHRFRILFQLEQPLYDIDFTRALMEALISEFAADESCKDPNRLFYGNPGCDNYEVRPDKFLDLEVAAALIEWKMGQWAQRKTDVVHVDREMSTAEREHMINLLCGLNWRFSGSYNNWVNLGFAMKRGGFTLQDFQYVSSRITNTKTPDVCERLWRSADPEGSMTMGTIIELHLRKIYSDIEIWPHKRKQLMETTMKKKKRINHAR